MTLRDDVLTAARSFSGLSYRLDPPPDGVTTIDCSLLILKALEKAGAPIAGVRTAEQIRQATVPISFDDVKPGDLLFFERTYDAAGPAGPDGKIASHVGFSLGKGTRRMVDAHERGGLDVAETDISPAYWQDKLIEARRIPVLANEQPAPVLRGIDVASYQGNPNWDAVQASGVAFAITKVTEDDGYVNPTFARNWREITRVGMVRGAYHFARPEVNDAASEADYMLAMIQQHGGPIEAGDLIALDLEAGSGDLGPWTLQFLHRVEQRSGVRALVYTGAWFSGPHNLAAYPEIGTYPLWLAAYQAAMPPPPKPWTSISIWQNSSEGSIPGIAGDVDTNLFNGTREQLLALGKPGTAPGPTPPQYAVGEGILAAMTERGDSPASDEMYTKRGERDEWSEAYGVSGCRYMWLPSVARIFVYEPAA